MQKHDGTVYHCRHLTVSIVHKNLGQRDCGH